MLQTHLSVSFLLYLHLARIDLFRLTAKAHVRRQGRIIGDFSRLTLVQVRGRVEWRIGT